MVLYKCGLIWFDLIDEMELRPTKNRQNHLISFQYFLYCNKLYKQTVSKQRHSQLAGSVTENVAKLSFPSEWMQAADHAHNFIVDFCLQTTYECWVHGSW